MKKLILPLFFASSFSYAGMNTPGTTSASVPQNLHIVNSNGDTYVHLPATGCSTSVYYLSPSHKKYDAIFSILLTAQTADKKVRVRFDKCVNGTSNPFGNIIGVYLND
ncbi:hypothetical protein [Pseudoalteromonas luteoviolacea]|uniref:Uncharacterized protein n=1 Tax=Pseudoalteromonas luteoviolacea S4054 TaxID=1129367 RepID=A0A0F6AH93_9GAMM|nr:hypothetical protein [Pseudoalteromonas luteoviolacea]AOT08704.1 hypothetical protein S4054249_12955 [Pseudoalteromonas luteoviolacea]AOT13619.1 hypothetical protein S40542_12930 [Pseudoalteromonas luteoviolacea]AOT18532.1 hypothetical protein S4054_12930 [Pseudoalteromonas luteoviolacea]KKE85595.1 hypothetical protein N479_25610 [Pseudoalteromonas luteoviolacea S4054]KZN71995.1 hypothetical protein N481_16420 [Pseudoalteromonas luteoviolacea S4047-1]